MGKRRPSPWVLAVFVAAALGVAAATASGSIGARHITIPLPTITLPTISLPGLGPPPAQAATPPASQPRSGQKASGNPFKSRGMWIWVIGSSNGGSLSSIIAQAHRYGVGTLYVKSSDGTSMWSQFNSTTVSTLRAHGIRVCAWQFVYGYYPRKEAQAGANAVRDGASCLVIDAEGQYEGRYYQAQVYITRLRQLIGTGFPVALAGLPYIDYHPAFPYSVFLGPGGAQYNAPQMYWRDIGTSVDSVYAHTYLYNRIYLRPIYPLGQVYNSPPAAQITRFRQLLRVYGAVGVSWWDWQEAGWRQWRAISRWVWNLANASAVPGMASISTGSAGDLVVWAQEHLRGAGESVSIDGGFGPQTMSAVEDFQLAHGLSVDGVIGPQTWWALLQYKPAYVLWTKRPTVVKTRRLGPGTGPTAAEVAAADTRSSPSSPSTPTPASALLPAKGHELPPSLGAGHP
jgi:hypothetical protein